MEIFEKKLSTLLPGQCGRVVNCIDNGRNIVKRLRDLGISEGETVKCIMRSPLGDPTAYLIKGSVIALRREDAAVVFVRPIGGMRDE
ncbi:MAG: ferrous iron transport protein A [Ruminococcaceae bacterium]|nr:ferrous iron transport protein A [Oscillospiraceae bacterium]